MKLPKSIPLPIFALVVIVFALIYGSFVAGSSNAPSPEPVYITDGTGGNLASVVNVNHHGHLSVHIADSRLPTLTGEVYARHIAYPARSGLLPGQCYAAYIRGGGEFINAVVRFMGSPAGRPQVLVRVDPDPVWVETGSPSSTPSSAVTGVTRSGDGYIFGYLLPLGFKSFVGVILCWHGSGRSDGFAVQITAANGGINPYRPEEILFDRHGRTFTWTKLQGPKPTGYQIVGTRSTLVSYYQSTSGTVSKPNQPLRSLGRPVLFRPHVLTFQTTVGASTHVYPRYYLFELQAGGDPTRVGPFGSFSGE